ncbi:MAG: peptidoglycan-binding protein, partial [Rhizobiales bacterium]|nr:peptidoglycan-binding protein [Hyphomicrobiales bacterium]
VLYDQAQAAGMEPIPIAIASTYAAFPGAAEIAGPPPRKKIEYGTAAFVDEAGYAVTTQMLVDGCALVTLAGFGPADIVATDKAANLALLRVYGAKVAPVALAAGAVPDAVSIVGVADPAAQAGGGAISTARAKVTVTAGAARPALDPAPPVGFDGAAALDASGRLAGLVGLPQAVVAGTPGAAPSPTLVPAKAVGDFLTKHAIVGADSTRIGAEAQRPAVTRLICVRK